MQPKRREVFKKLEKYIKDDEHSDWDGMGTSMLQTILEAFELKEKFNEIDWKTVLNNWATDDDGVPDDSELFYKLQELVGEDK